jgi:hypothetical protein
MRRYQRRDTGDFNQRAARHSSAAGYCRPYGRVWAKSTAIHLVHRVVIADVMPEDVHLQDFVHGGTGGLQFSLNLVDAAALRFAAFFSVTERKKIFRREGRPPCSSLRHAIGRDC